MAETAAILAWTLVSECPVPNDVHELLVAGETAQDGRYLYCDVHQTATRL